jgi:galactosamine-6-phosphate isomerase
MLIFVADTYEALSKLSVNHLTESLRSIDHPLICTASGDSPAGLYKELVEKVRKKELDIKNYSFVGLDEWAGMNGEDEGSCRFHLNNQLFNPLKISPEKICFFDGRSEDLSEECNKTEQYIKQHGGIDIAILGLGMNGHIGMNEPGTSPALRSHVARIDPLTAQVGQKYFSDRKTLSHGITLGLSTIMEARQIMLIVNGAHKARIVQKAMKGEVSDHLPASILQHHPGLNVYLDKAAAQMISSI